MFDARVMIIFKALLGGLRVIAIGVVGAAATVLIAALGSWLWLAKDLPDPRAVLIAAVPPCPVTLADTKTSVPPVLRAAIVAAEDRGFERRRLPPTLHILAGHRLMHQSLAGAQIWNSHPHDRAFIRSIQSLVQADRIYLALSKDEVLDAYAAQSFLGHGMTGFGCAAAGYFGKTMDQLDTGEAALLAVLLRGPSVFDPVRAPDRALMRRNAVLDAMTEDGAITRADAMTAKVAPLGILSALK